MHHTIPEPLVITGASGQVGRALVSALQARGIRAQALVRRPCQLRDCDEFGDWLVSPAAQQVLAQAASVVHLAGNLNPAHGDYHAANSLTAERVAATIHSDTCKRLVFLSFLGAKTEDSNAYLASKAAAEAILQASGAPTTILRCNHIIGTPTQPGPTASSLLAGCGGLVAVLGDGQQCWAPLAVTDVVSAILAALEQNIDGCFDLQGPEVFTVNTLIKLLNPGQRLRCIRIPARVAPMLRFAGLPRALIAVMLNDCVSQANPPSAMAASMFGLNLTSLGQLWR